MDALKTLSAELRKVQVEREAELLLEVLRRHFDTLTFGDIADLVRSRVGAKLGAVKLSEVFAGSPAKAAVVAVPQEGALQEDAPHRTKLTRRTRSPAAPAEDARRSAEGHTAVDSAKARAKRRKTSSKSSASPSSKSSASPSSKTSASTSPVAGVGASPASSIKMSTSMDAATPPRAPGPPRAPASPKAPAASPTGATAQASMENHATEGVLGVLAASEGPVSIATIVMMTKLSQRRILRALDQLVGDGVVQRVGILPRVTYVLVSGPGPGVPAGATQRPAG